MRVRTTSSAGRIALAVLGGCLLAGFQGAASAQGSADLLTVYNDALERNPQYRAEAAQYRATQQLVPIAFGKLLPQVGLRARYEHIWENIEGQYYNVQNFSYDDDYDRHGYGGVLQQVIFNGASFSALDAAKLKVTQAGFALEGRQDALGVEVVETYFAALGAAEGLRYANAEQVAPFLAREVPGIVVQTVPGQPVLSVRGTEKQLAEVESLLAQIDRAPEQGPPVFQRAYQLSNAKAVELAQVLQEALKARQAQNQGQQNQALPTREATVVADPRTNTLIVTGTQEDLALVEGLIPKLDQPVPQVSLRVRIQEVQSNLTRSLGLKWNSIAGGNVAASILDSGLSLIFDSTRSLAALNIMATLDALQQQGLSRALRDVNQTVLNNQTARLQSGETFFIRRVVNDQVERVPFDVGLIVEVTPQITADGQILLNIKAEISGNVQRNPVDGDVDRFTKQVVTTTLRVKDGETVVLGGLTSQESNQSQQGVPLLMDIPLIGELFKQRTNESTDKELLVVITADILKETASANP